MIYAYAIEPKALIAWAKNRWATKFIMDNFGIGKSRLFAEFPQLKNWRKQLRRSFDTLSDKEKTNAVELFKHLTEKCIVSEPFEYDGNLAWIDNAIIEMDKQNFQAIIAEENLKNTPCVLKSNYSGEWPSKYWEVDDGVVIPRQAEFIANAVYPMIRNSQKVVFIDPYFRIDKPKWHAPLKSIFDKVSADRKKSCKKIDFEIHIGDFQELSEKFYKDENGPKLYKILPEGASVTVFRWKQRSNGEKLHNRYILTDIGGVQFGIGLDEGKEGETDEITLMNRRQYLTRWEQYCSDSPAFELDFKFSVVKDKGTE